MAKKKSKDGKDTQQFDITPGCKMLSRLLVDHRVMLSSLDLSNNPLGNYGAIALAQVLPHTPLRELKLSNVQMTTVGFNCISRVLRFTTSLALLDVSKNTIGFDGLTSLFRQLPYTQIAHLNLDSLQFFLHL